MKPKCKDCGKPLTYITHTYGNTGDKVCLNCLYHPIKKIKGEKNER